MLLDFKQLKKNLKLETNFNHKLRLAILGDSATQFLNIAIKGYGIELGIDIEIYEAPYHQITLQVQNPNSELYNFKPDYVLLFESEKKLIQKFYKTPIAQRSSFYQQQADEVGNYYEILNNRLNSKLLYVNFCENNDGIFGSYANKYTSSYLYQVRAINRELANIAAAHANLFLVDLLNLQNQFGAGFISDINTYIQTDMYLSLDCLPYFAKSILDIIKTNLGIFKKCLILDLDNTVWGGVIGDDGINNIQIGGLGIGKAFTALQLWAKELKNRGIIIAVASKNTESIALEPFQSHPEMILREDDISVFMVNWDNKVQNIQRIQEVLNIGFDSMVFIDDNPFERNIVRQNLPDVTVPELPEDPALYLSYLIDLNLFETNAVSETDSDRTEKYKQESKRVNTQQYFTNEKDFLKSLDMQATIDDLSEFNLPRISQLSMRSNQFNLRTIRFDEESLKNFGKKESSMVKSFYLKDKYGDHGLIAAIFASKTGGTLFIDNWIMSCRVLKRGMENFTLNQIVQFAIEKDCDKIVGEYLQTPKNGIVENHYKDLGFTQEDKYWTLQVSGFKPLETEIN